MTTAEKVLSGFILGVTVGAVLGILYAPKKGYKMRKLLAKRANGIKDTAEKTYHSAKDILGIEKKKLSSTETSRTSNN